MMPEILIREKIVLELFRLWHVALCDVSIQRISCRLVIAGAVLFAGPSIIPRNDL